MAKRNNQEFFQIQKWVAEWSGTSVEECKFTWEDIREICRGPMREVLLDFVLPRFRADEQIEVMRTNLYLNEISSKKDPSGAGSQLDKEIEDLKKKVNEIKEEKTKVLKRISVHLDTLTKSKIDMQQRLMEKVTILDDFHTRAKFVKSRVTSTNTLLKSLQITQSDNGASTSSSPNGDNLASDSASSHQTLLCSLYKDTMDLFNMYFLQDANSTPAGQSEMQALEATVSLKTTKLRQCGVSPYLIESWARGEQEKSANQLRNAANKLTDVMSPISELTGEAETLYINFMKALIAIHYRNKVTQAAEQALESQNFQNLQNMVLSDACALPTDLMALMEKEELLAAFKKCKELKAEFEDRNSKNQGADEDLMKLIGGGAKAVSSQQTENSYNEQNRSKREGSSGFMLANVSEETLEDLTCALFKSFPQSARKLESTVKGCRNLVFNEFPTTLQAASSVKSKGTVAQCESEKQDHLTGDSWGELQVQIPKKWVVNADLVFPNEGLTTDISLVELFNLKTELDKKQMQSKVVTSEFNKSKEDHS